MTIKKALRKVTKAIKKDPSYRETWKANIAMAFVDNASWHKKEKGKDRLNNQDIHEVANKAADYFLDQLCK